MFSFSSVSKKLFVEYLILMTETDNCVFKEIVVLLALNTRGSRKSCIEKRRALNVTSIEGNVGDGGQQISNSSASVASSSGAGRGGSRSATTKEHQNCGSNQYQQATRFGAANPQPAGAPPLLQVQSMGMGRAWASSRIGELSFVELRDLELRECGALCTIYIVTLSFLPVLNKTKREREREYIRSSNATYTCIDVHP